MVESLEIMDEWDVYHKKTGDSDFASIHNFFLIEIYTTIFKKLSDGIQRLDLLEGC
jgi:hypothetical protein